MAMSIAKALENLQKTEAAIAEAKAAHAQAKQEQMIALGAIIVDCLEKPKSKNASTYSHMSVVDFARLILRGETPEEVTNVATADSAEDHATADDQSSYQSGYSGY